MSAGPQPFGPMGDDDPEDAWNADDPPADRLEVLGRRLRYAAQVAYLLSVDHQPPNADLRRRLRAALDDLAVLTVQVGA